MNAVLAYNCVEENGKTMKENNLDMQHDIPLGSLVEISGEGGCMEYDGLRLFVVKLSRDCDGTPLYDLSYNKDAQTELDQLKYPPEVLSALPGIKPYNEGFYHGMIIRGFSAESLKVVR